VTTATGSAAGMIEAHPNAAKKQSDERKIMDGKERRFSGELKHFPSKGAGFCHRGERHMTRANEASAKLASDLLRRA
jgi:hypothetical protein